MSRFSIRSSHHWFIVLLVSFAVSSAGCAKNAARHGAEEKPGLHKDVAPHGGTAVAVGDNYTLELVRDADTGTLSAYVLDGEMEQFIRSSSRSITLVTVAGGNSHTLVLAAIANPATGETVGDSSLFETSADWLKTTPQFSAVLQDITIRGTRFDNLKFSFPQGTDHE